MLSQFLPADEFNIKNMAKNKKNLVKIEILDKIEIVAKSKF